MERVMTSTTRSLGYCVIAAVSFTSSGWAADAVDYIKQVKPILEKHCYKCHGAEADKGDLRLHNATVIQDSGGVEPGSPDDSELLRRLLLPEDDDESMPKSAKPLSADDIKLVRLWIEQGADYGNAAEVEKEEVKEPTLFDTITEASEEAMENVREVGAQVMRIAANTQAVSVDFRFRDEPATDEQLAGLGDLAEHVVWLDLRGTKVTNDGLAALRDLKYLMRLHLEKTGITDAGLDHLADMQHLEYLNLYGTGVTNAGLQRLKDLKSLRKLYLWQAPVTRAAANDLADSIEGLEIVLGEDHPELLLEKTKKDLEEATKEKEESAKKEEESKKAKEAAATREEEAKKKITELEAALPAFLEKAGVNPEPKKEETEDKKEDKPAEEKDE